MMTTPEKISADLFEAWQVTGKMRRLSFTGLTKFMESPYNFVEYLTEKENRTEDIYKKHYSDGHAFEFFMFKGLNADPNEKFYICDISKRPCPNQDFKVKANRVWRDEQIAKALIAQKTFAWLHQIESAKAQVKAYSREKFWLAPDAKNTYQFHAHGEINGVNFHGHIDLLCEYKGKKFVIDTKSTGKKVKKPEWFILDMNTHVQLLIYKILSRADGVFVAISESEKPYNCYGYEVKYLLDDAFRLVEKYTNEYKRWYSVGCPLVNNCFFEQEKTIV